MMAVFNSRATLSAVLLLAGLLISLAGCGEQKPADGDGPTDGKKIRVGFVTNCVANFWRYGEQGAKKAGEELGIEVEVQMPTTEGGISADQKRRIEQLLSNGVDGIAVAPSDPENQSDILNAIAAKACYITHDTDAPNTKRRLFIGISNYDGGREVGKLVKRAIPDGGNVVLFIGTISQNNGRLRRQGVIDELLDREPNPENFDEPGSVIEGPKYTILETKIDQFDEIRKKEMPEQALAKYEKIDCMVGLFEYNPPKIFAALRAAGKMGEIKVVGFDEAFETLDEVANGNCEGTVVQNPYEYGYKSVQVMHDIITGKNDYQDTDYIEIPLRVIDTPEKAKEYKQYLNELLEASSAAGTP